MMSPKDDMGMNFAPRNTMMQEHARSLYTIHPSLYENLVVTRDT